MASNYNILIQKLDEFTRKYYKNQILKGLLYSSALILVFYLTVTLLEYFGRFSTTVRTVLFWAFIAFSAFILGRYVLLPLFRLLRLGKQISHKEAASIVGKHFTEVKDKLLNTLQLQEMATVPGARKDLIEASIDQKIGELRPVPFASAVDFSENKKYLRYVLPPLAVIVILLLAAPSILTDSTERLVKYNQEITLEAPYSIELLNDELSVPENEDFTVRIQLSGDVIPDKVYIVQEGSQFKLSKENSTTFNYQFRDVRSDQSFRFYGDGFYSENYTLEAIPVPGLVQFNVALDYPSYTGMRDENLRNTGDFTVPEGTKATWSFNTRNASDLKILFGDSIFESERKEENKFSFAQQLMSDEKYALMPGNSNVEHGDSIGYLVRVIPDRHPGITVVEEKDSLSRKHLYFTGEVKDDYGFRNLTFNYEFVKSDKEGRELNKVIRQQLAVNKELNSDRFFYHWELDELELAPGEEISYYFEVWDNDAVNGSKSTKSSAGVFKSPTTDELKAQEEEANEDIKDDLEEGIKQAKDLQKELEELRKDMLNKENLNWQDKKKIEELLEKQKQLQKTAENIKQQNEQKNQNKSEFEQPNESIMEKQEQLQKLFDELMTDEMKQMYEELQKMMEELNKEEIQEQMEQMNMSAEDMEKELDRALEQFKQMEWEQKMEETIEKLDQLAEKQEELSEKSESGEGDSEELKKEQDKLNEEFEELREELDELEKMNEELENPNNMLDNEDQQESIQQEMQESSDQLNKNKQKKAGESQKNASDQMKEMAQQMQMAMQQGQEESAQEDMDALRALLENIITLSFDQESLMDNFGKIDRKDPKYVSYGQEQRKLKDDAKIVEDSLFALSKRVIQIEPIVLREIRSINEHMEEALVQIGERQTPVVTENQQYVMTSFNNLALLLDEALKQMQQQMAQKQPGQGNCEKPGGQGSKPSMSQMKKMQEALSKQLEQMKENMGKKGQQGKPNRPKPGMSQQIAQMAAQQAAIRREIEKMSQQLNEDGSKSGNGLKEIAKEMEDLERDLVNMQIDEATLRRQQDILTRLLKAENAEREREMDEKRRSNEAREELISNPMRYSEYKERKERELELLKTVPPTLKPYYKDKVNEYFNKLGD